MGESMVGNLSEKEQAYLEHLRHAQELGVSFTRQLHKFRHSFVAESGNYSLSERSRRF